MTHLYINHLNIDKDTIHLIDMMCKANRLDQLPLISDRVQFSCTQLFGYTFIFIFSNDFVFDSLSFNSFHHLGAFNA